MYGGSGDDFYFFGKELPRHRRWPCEAELPRHRRCGRAKGFESLKVSHDNLLIVHYHLFAYRLHFAQVVKLSKLSINKFITSVNAREEVCIKPRANDIALVKLQAL